jgi:pyruvate dehydrogenase E2 component (dihydrolipoamide acetyltransferase)
MATAVLLPALSPTMKEGKITRWLKKEGDKISSGTAIAECETDKSNLEIEAYDDGVLLKILVAEGGLAPVGSPIAYIGKPGEKVEAAPAAAPVAAAPAPAPAAAAPKPAPILAAAPKPAPLTTAVETNGRVRASPLAKAIAKDQGVDLARVAGSGPSGRIVKRDVEQAAQAGPLTAKGPATKAFPRAARGARPEPEAIPLTQMRKVIAQRLGEVKPGVPHFYLTVEVEMDEAMGVKDQAKALETKVSVNDVIVKAAAVALRRFPRLNQQFADDRILQLQTVDVGVAVAIEEGLITPVVRDADQKGLAEISAEVKDLADRARRKALKPEEYSGGSITVSNLGMFGIDSFVAIINPPHAAILAVGAVAPKAVVRDGQIVMRQMMSVTLSGDHRVIDGAVGAQYLQVFKGILEHPLRMLF